MYLACKAHAPSVTSPVVPNFPQRLINGSVNDNKIIDHKMCIFFFSTTVAYKILSF
jgi:hypothetical protein